MLNKHKYLVMRKLTLNKLIIAVTLVFVGYLIYRGSSLNKVQVNLNQSNPRSIDVKITRSVSPTIEVPLSERKKTALDIYVKNSQFDPQTITIIQASQITFTNFDKINHDAQADDKSFDTGLILPGKSQVVTFMTPGTYNYHSVLNPKIKGTIKVDKMRP